LHGWLEKALATLSRKLETAPAAHRLPGPEELLFARSDDGRTRCSDLCADRSAKFSSLDPELYLRQVRERIADHPIQRISELLRWNISLPIQVHSYRCSHIHGDSSTLTILSRRSDKGKLILFCSPSIVYSLIYLIVIVVKYNIGWYFKF
jgi:hypothetical protein